MRFCPAWIFISSYSSIYADYLAFRGWNRVFNLSLEHSFALRKLRGIFRQWLASKNGFYSLIAHSEARHDLYISSDMYVNVGSNNSQGHAVIQPPCRHIDTAAEGVVFFPETIITQLSWRRRLAKTESEGLTSGPAETWQSQAFKNKPLSHLHRLQL